MYIFDHFREMRYKSFYCLVSFLITWMLCYRQKELLFFIYIHYLSLFSQNQQITLVTTQVTETFQIQLILSFLLSVYFLIPLILYMIISFLIEGLQKREVRIILLITIFILFFLYYLLPILHQFCFSTWFIFFLSIQQTMLPALPYIQCKNLLIFYLWMDFITIIIFAIIIYLFLIPIVFVATKTKQTEIKILLLRKVFYLFLFSIIIMAFSINIKIFFYVSLILFLCIETYLFFLAYLYSIQQNI